MTWAQRLKCVFQIEIERCVHCGGSVKVIASIDDPQVIERMLTHLANQAAWPAGSESFRVGAKSSNTTGA